MTAPIMLSISYLVGTAVAVSKGETRFYLNGVHIEVQPYGVLYAATDGHLLTVCRSATAEPLAGEGRYIIPSEVITTIKKWKSKSGSATLSFRTDGKAEITDGVNLVEFSMIDGTFPDFRRIIPRAVKPEMVPRLDGALLLRAQEFAKVALGVDWGDRDDPPTVHWNGEGASIVTFGAREALVAFMPMRNGSDAYPSLEWLS